MREGQLGLTVLSLAALTGCVSPSGPAFPSQPNPVTLSPPGAPQAQAPLLPSGSYAQKIDGIAQSSSCAGYYWAGRGVAPLGYARGMALTFARSLCRFRAGDRAAKVMAEASTGASATDALAYYGLSAPDTSESTIQALYTLGLGVGMRESSGEYCMGWDTTAGSNRSSSAGEAGLFQTSYDSIGTSIELQSLYDDYRKDPSRCFLATFAAGMSCAQQSNLGTGAGADFQAFTKSCPAFAAEYAMIVLRVDRSHYGSVNRQEAEVVPACAQMLADVQTDVDQEPAGTCRDVL